MTVRNSNPMTLTGWSAVSVLATIAITKALTALVMSLPLTWLFNRVFATGAVRAIFGADQVSYWRCVGLFAIWFTARIRIEFSGPRKSR